MFTLSALVRHPLPSVSHHSACLPLLSLKDFKGESRSPAWISWWPEPEPCLIWPLWGWIGGCLQAGRMQVQSVWTVRQQGLWTYVLILALRWPISVQRSLHSAVPGLPAGWHFLSILHLLYDESTDTSDCRWQRLMFSGITWSSFLRSDGDFFSHTGKKPEHPDLQALAGFLVLELSPLYCPFCELSDFWLQTFLLPCSQPWWCLIWHGWCPRTWMTCCGM